MGFWDTFVGNDNTSVDNDKLPCGCSWNECCDKCCRYWRTKSMYTDDTEGCRDCDNGMSNRTK